MVVASLFWKRSRRDDTVGPWPLRANFPESKSTRDAGCSRATGTFCRRQARSNSLPRAKGLEIAFAGRSNVGKSSLINALTGRRALARTSNTPGRTQELIFFGSSSRLVLVDLPGYGYAATAKSKVTAWTRLIHDYLHGRAALARVYVLIDARHGLKTIDEAILDTLSRAAVSHEIVLTKSDQVSEAELASRVEEVKAVVRKRPAVFPELIATSARSGARIPQLRAAVARLLAERSR